MMQSNDSTSHVRRPQQLIYRRDVGDCGAEEIVVPNVNLQFFVGPFRAITYFAPLVHVLGWRGWLKAIAKLTTPSRNLYAVFLDGECASYGWIMRGRCRAYRIEPTACVIGPIFTSHHLRGRGLAPLGIRFAVRELFRRGWRTFYIDTSSDNRASQRAIVKSGFTGPIAGLPSRCPAGVQDRHDETLAAPQPS